MDWIGDILKKARESKVLDTRDAEHLPGGTRYRLTFTDNSVMMIEMLDPSNGHALISNQVDSSDESLEGYLEGSFFPERELTQPDNVWRIHRFFLPGQLKMLGAMRYQINGAEKTNDAIKDVVIILPNGTEYAIWRD